MEAKRVADQEARDAEGTLLTPFQYAYGRFICKICYDHSS